MRSPFAANVALCIACTMVSTFGDNPSCFLEPGSSGRSLACCDCAVISHRSAAGLWRLVAQPEGEVDVTVVGRHCRSRPGIRVHRVGSLDGGDSQILRGIPATSPARTLLDFAHQAAPHELARAIAEAY